MLIWVALLMAQSAAPSQIDRGEALFLDPALGCGTCHALKGKGTAVGPDLGESRVSVPAGIAMAIRSSVTQYVQVVKLKSGESFPDYASAGGRPGRSSSTTCRRCRPNRTRWSAPTSGP